MTSTTNNLKQSAIQSIVNNPCISNVENVYKYLINNVHDPKNASYKTASFFGYRYKKDKTKTALGRCNFSEKWVSLSIPFLEANLNKPKILVNTMLHEIAHALAYELYNCDSHGSVWKNLFLRLGGNGERCVNVRDINAIKSKYFLICTSCNYKKSVHRRLRLERSCRQCGGNTYNEKFKLKLIKNY